MVTRSKVGIVKKNPKYACQVSVSSSISRSHIHALRDPNWQHAMLDEYNALISNDGPLSRYKARLVANGRSQQQGIDCDETFSPVVKPATIRTVLSLAVSHQWPIHQLDVKNAFLHGYYVFLGDNLITWSSKRQHVTSRSSAEAEYRGVANAVAETAWVRNLLRELLVPLRIATLVYCDNVSAVYLSCNSVQHQRTKHMEIDIHFVHDFVATGHICVLHVPSQYQFADIFTKGIPSPLFAEFRSSLSVRPPPAPTAGAY
ncbi:ribonuclease H-like domain-containing protein [Tanacetum coccineum]